MATYFVDPYKKYHEELSSASNLVSSGENIVAEGQSLLNIGDRLQIQLESSTWRELGYDQLVMTTIPNLKKKFKALNDNLTFLMLTCNEVICSLLPLTTSLKENDTLYEKKLEELKNLVEPSQKYRKNSLGEETNFLTDEYIRYENTLFTLEAEIAKLKDLLEKLKIEIDDKISDIKNISSSMTTFSGLCLVDNTSTSNGELEEQLEDLIEDSYEQIGKIDVFTGALTYNEGKTLLYNDVGTQQDGYRRLIYTSHGKMITVFKQGWSEPIKFSDDRTKNFRDHGCAFHAVASILSSNYPGITPDQVFKDLGKEKVIPSDIKKYLEEDYNIKIGDRNEIDSRNYDEYKKHLVEEVSKGNMVLTTVNTKDKKYSSNISHWVVVVDYDKDVDKFYISDSGDKNNVNYEPIDVDTFLKRYAINTNVVYIADDSGYYDYPNVNH